MSDLASDLDVLEGLLTALVGKLADQRPILPAAKPTLRSNARQALDLVQAIRGHADTLANGMADLVEAHNRVVDRLADAVAHQHAAA